MKICLFQRSLLTHLWCQVTHLSVGHQMIHSPSNILGSYGSSFPVNSKSWPTVVSEIIISVSDTKSWAVRSPLTSWCILQCRCSTRRSITRLAKIEFRTRAGLLLFNQVPRRKLRSRDVQRKHVLIHWWLKFRVSLGCNDQIRWRRTTSMAMKRTFITLSTIQTEDE